MTNLSDTLAALIEVVAKMIDPDAWHETLPTDGCGAYWHGRRATSRDKALRIIDHIACASPSEIEADDVVDLDRSAAHAFILATRNRDCPELISGHWDSAPVVQAFAAHRRSSISDATRTGQLVPVPSVERVAMAMCRAPGSLCVGFCHSKHCRDAVAQYETQATAVIAAMKEGQDV